MTRINDKIKAQVLREVQAKWMLKNVVTDAAIGEDTNGDTVLVIGGPGAQPPKGLPKGVVLPVGKIPTVWRQSSPNGGFAAFPMASSGESVKKLAPLANEDIDRAYWHFFTPVDRRQIEISIPNSEVPRVGSLEALPPIDGVDTQIHFPMRLPQYDVPEFWSKPFEMQGCTCCSFYERWFNLYSFAVPDDHMLIIDGVSVSLTGVGIGEIVEVQMLRDGETAVTFEDMLADPAAADPAHQMAFSGYVDYIPMHLNVDRSRMLTVRVKLRGTYPFSKTMNDTFGGTVCVLVHGWLASLMDSRDDAPRPISLGIVNDVALGDMDGFRAIEDLEWSEKLEVWLTEVIAKGGLE